MKTIKIFFFIFALNTMGLLAGNGDGKESAKGFGRKFEEAESLYNKKDFSRALDIFLKLYNEDPANANLCYKVGACYLQSMLAKEKAIYFLEKAAGSTSAYYKEGSHKEKNAPILTYKLLGEAYHRHSQFDKAINSFEKYKRCMGKTKITDHELIKEANREIEMCHTAKKLTAAPVNIKIENLGKKVNSAYPDYSPVFSADQSTMIFTSSRPENMGGQTYDGGKYFEDIYISTRSDSGWGQAVNIGPPINTVGNDASVGISADGQQILIYKDDMGDGNIYSTSLNGNTWSIPVKLNAHINSEYWEPSAFITADGNTLYFTSDRPGGYGGRDLYKSHKDAHGDWGKAINLGGAINTPFDEDAPYMHPDGVTLFFSSNGHETMGGFDIFESTLLSNGTWGKPVNIGYPVNSPDDDVFYVVSPDKKTAYYTSVREDGFGEKDNYKITFPDVKETSLTLQTGRVTGPDNIVPKDLKIIITDNETQEVVGIYSPNTLTGKYLYVLPPGKSYNIAYEAKDYLFYSENHFLAKDGNYDEVTKTVKLAPIEVGSRVTLNNLFFDFDKAVLRPSSNVELKRLYDFLTTHPSLAVEIAGYTDAKGNDEYNAKLSEERANAVVNYLSEKGISRSRMTGVGHGKADPKAPNQHEDGTDNPDGRQLNRRVELKITNIK